MTAGAANPETATPRMYMKKEHHMRRPATKSWPREDIDHSQGGSEADIAEPAPDPVASSVVETVEDSQPEPEIPPLQIARERTGRGGIVSLIIIAIFGMVIGFAAVMLM
jgi:hypothetical protein